MKRLVTGFRFLLVFADGRTRWTQVWGSGGLFGDGALAAIAAGASASQVRRKVLMRARVELERRGELRAFTSWDLPAAERSEVVHPTEVRACEIITGVRR